MIEHRSVIPEVLPQAAFIATLHDGAGQLVNGDLRLHARANAA
jgi:hypothetical protein